jgi:hypothetical protein
VVREEKEPDRYLADEERLGEREQLRNGRSGVRSPRPERRGGREDTDADQEECVHMVRR